MPQATDDWPPHARDISMNAISDTVWMDTIVNPPALIAKANVQVRDWGNVRFSDESGFKKVVTSCADVRGFASINPEGDILAYLGYSFDAKSWKYQPTLDLSKDVKFSVLQAPKHGVVGWGVQYGPDTYGYKITERNSDGEPAYFGPDKVIYQVEVKGQKFKVIFNLLSIPEAESFGGQVCESRRFSLADMSSGTIATWLASAQHSALLSEVSGVTMVMADLPGSSIGQTTGSGTSAQITLGLKRGTDAPAIVASAPKPGQRIFNSCETNT